MLNKKNNSQINFNRFSIIPIIEGLDLFLCFSIITYLSIFFLSELDNRLSLVIITFIILLSFFSRIFYKLIIKNLPKLLKNRDLNFLLLLAFIYLIPVFLVNDSNYISLLFFAFSRIIIGILISHVSLEHLKRIVNENDKHYFTKYFLLLITGMIIGSFIFLFIDDIFSNNQLNQWAWKLVYFIIFLIIIINFFVLRSVNASILMNFEYDETEYERSPNLKPLKTLFNNFFILIPITTLIFFCSSRWLPRFANPENMQFLEFDLVMLILIFLIIVFIYPLINLVGKKKIHNFFGTSFVLISTLAFFFEYNSSYSIDLLKFYLALTSSFSVSIYYLNSSNFKNFNMRVVIDVQNIFYFILSILIPLLFYYSINFSLSYNNIYLLIGLFFLISIVFEKYAKKR